MALFNSLVMRSFCLLDYLGFFLLWTVISTVYRESMISSFLKCMMVIFLIVLARTLSTILTIVGKNGH